MSGMIRVTREQAIVRLVLDRPTHGNQLHLEGLKELAGAVREASRDEAVKAIVLSGEGEDFCLGRDPGPGAAVRPSAMQMRQRVLAPILDAYAAIRDAEIPVIAAVHGRAFGFGCAIASACDIVIAADNARFKLPEMEKDLPPTLAISALLGKVAPKTIAYLVYSLDEIDAARAMSVGIVSHAVPRGSLSATVERLAATIGERSRPACSAVKEYLRAAPLMEPRGAADFAGNLLANVLSSQGG
jgi:enoyl-CoA hydratase